MTRLGTGTAPRMVHTHTHTHTRARIHTHTHTHTHKHTHTQAHRDKLCYDEINCIHFPGHQCTEQQTCCHKSIICVCVCVCVPGAYVCVCHHMYDAPLPLACASHSYVQLLPELNNSESACAWMCLCLSITGVRFVIKQGPFSEAMWHAVQSVASELDLSGTCHATVSGTIVSQPVSLCVLSLEFSCAMSCCSFCARYVQQSQAPAAPIASFYLHLSSSNQILCCRFCLTRIAVRHTRCLSD